MTLLATAEASEFTPNVTDNSSPAHKPGDRGSTRSNSSTARVDWLRDAFDTHRAELQSYILRKMGSREEAEELTQDVFVRLMRYEKPGSINNLQAFLFTTANNIVRDRIRRLHARNHNFHDTIDQLEIDAGICLEQCLEAEQGAEVLGQALGELDDEYRRALILHRLESWTHAQIAEELNTTVGVVRRYISVALAYCQQRIEGSTTGKAFRGACVQA